MKLILCCLLLVQATIWAPAPPARTTAPRPPIAVYLTTADLSSRLARQPNLRFAPAGRSQPRLASSVQIAVDDTKTYQRIDGFGAAMTDTAAWLLDTQLAPSVRFTVMHDLFDPAYGIGLTMVRIPIGASDFTRDGVPYSYDDSPSDTPDPALDGFSIAHDMSYTIPLLRDALSINPALKLIAAPWVLPSWMKTRLTTPFGGAINPADYAPLAAYFVKFLQAYQAQDLPIYAVTPQNEPGQDPGYPGTIFPAGQETAFIGGYLGPALAGAGLTTRILAYDSFWNTGLTTPDYPFLVLGDPRAGPYVAGTAWHCYSGDPGVMARMHAAYPTKDNYVTECSSGFAPGDVSELIIASLRNWANGVLLWNLALDQYGGPPPQGTTGCPNCIAPVTVYTDTANVSLTNDYYQIGQASRFIHPGADRIASTSPMSGYDGNGSGCASGMSYGVQTVDDVAARNPDGSIVLLAYNAGRLPQTLVVHWRGQSISYGLAPCATATFVWSSKQH